MRALLAVSLTDNTSDLGKPVSTAQAAALAPIRPTIVNSVSTSYSVAGTDENKLITLNNASAITVYLQSDSTPVGGQVNFVQLGAGQATFTPFGATVNGTPGLKLRAQYSAATAIKIAAGAWVVVGDLSV
jgi:hypothetical protein